ncbi:site-2 protease family protein [Sandaracinus amylolyticus]|uniref:site-2 protease family protein n=1 Tax=Sandaracinus amylolyticus TaxID=927083 RepID=UPI001F3BFC79|nr:site-2 protease family protein [Sandaracinus amylolyticus]UJR79173.1 Integral membrane protease [Sandaracinus amylolyticus]
MSEIARTWWAEWRVPLALIVLTFVSTLWAGALMGGSDPWERPLELIAGWDFALPLMAILLAHELGHYVVGRMHRVDISPPFFIPMPPTYFLLGTMGAVIRMRGVIRDRNALLDVGAAGPLAGMAVALPVLIYGIATSPVQPLPESGGMLIEGRSIFYLALLYALKGPIPAGHDIMLSSTAFAGWAGLLVTMMNLLPFGQLDGGHIAYALLGKTQDRIARGVLVVLPFVAIATGLFYAVPLLAAGERGDPLIGAALAGVSWLVWFFVLGLMSWLSGIDHPPFEPGTLTPARRVVAIGCLVLFVLLFMPSWMRAG